MSPASRSRSADHDAAAARGGSNARSACTGSAAGDIASISRRALAGPKPGSSCATRNPASRPRGFSAQRSTLSTSFTCVLSRNFRPPNLTNGMLRRVSSSSSGAAWLEVRNSTAWRFSRRPCSRRSSTLSATHWAWRASSSTVTSCGRSVEALSVHSRFSCRSRAIAMTALDASRIGCVER